jgi:uncharacterized protein
MSTLVPGATKVRETSVLPTKVLAGRTMGRGPSSWWLLGGLGLVLGAMLGGLASGGEAQAISLVGLEFCPILGLCALAQLGKRHAGFRVVGWVWFALLLLGIAMLSVGMVFAALTAGSPDGNTFQSPVTLLETLGLLGLGLTASTVLLVTRVWVGLGRRLGAVVEASQAGQAQAVVGLLFFTLAATTPLVFLEGQAPLLAAVAKQDLAGGRSALGQALDLVYLVVWAVPLALVGAGFPLGRGFRQAAARLGIGSLRRSDLPVILGLSLGLAVVGIGTSALTDWVWAWAGWRSTDGALVQRLLGAPAGSPLGILCIGLSAGLTEELLVRGLLQPRLGWLLPNVAFAAAHAFQYGVDGLLVVFIVGAVQAGVRARWNTTAAVLTHSAYDTLLLLAAMIGAPGT